MKKLTTLLLVLCLLAGVTACGSIHPIDQLRSGLSKEKNCQIILTVEDIPLLGQISVTVQLDGNKQYRTGVLGMGEKYLETVDGTTYQYTHILGDKWVKTQIEQDKEAEKFEELMQQAQEIFVKENFKKVKGENLTYRQRSDVTFDSFQDVTVRFEKDACTVTGKVDMDGVPVSVKILVNEIGQVSLTLPQVN